MERDEVAACKAGKEGEGTRVKSKASSLKQVERKPGATGIIRRRERESSRGPDHFESAGRTLAILFRPRTFGPGTLEQACQRRECVIRPPTEPPNNRGRVGCTS